MNTLTLNDIFIKNNCDKGYKHKYGPVYEQYFQKFKNEEINILEIGILRGESIRSWLEYFPKAKIYCVDVFTRVKPEDIDCLNDPRVFWMKQDSTREDFAQNIVKEWRNIQFDFIIDDGLHNPFANRKTFENAVPFLVEDGIYFIEDVWMLNSMTDEEKKHSWLKRNSEVYTDEEHNKFLKTISNYYYIETDLRKISKEPDSFLLLISKQPFFLDSK